MTLMAILGAIAVIGIVLAVRWCGLPYVEWRSGAAPTDADADAAAHPDADPDGRPRPVSSVAKGYLRGVAVALVGGVWAGVLVTGPLMRLIMRLLAVTAGDGAQGRLTEAEEIVGDIDLSGTAALMIFGGIFPGLVSGALYVVLRRVLPRGPWGGVVFGLLHLVVAGTRIDPLRPDNPDFDIVGPGWLSVLTFGLAAVLHGVAVVGFANRYSAELPRSDAPRSDAPPADRAAATTAARVRTFAPLVVPVLLLIPGAFLVAPILAGLAVAVLVTRVPNAEVVLRSPQVVRGLRVVVAVLAVVLLPGTLTGLRDVVVRDGPAATPSD